LAEILLDDWLDSIKHYSKQALGYAKNFLSDNKDTVINYVADKVNSFIPGSR